MAFKILHISDLHFGAHDDDRVQELKHFVDHWQPHIIAITGDIVDFPRRRYFLEAAAFLRQIQKYCPIVVPGNHDALFWKLSLTQFRYHFGTPTNSHVLIEDTDIGDVCIFGVDTTMLSFKSLNNRGSFGKVAHQKLSQNIIRLNQRLGEGFRRAFKVALVHHHPLPTLSSEMEGMLYFNHSGQFMNLVAKNEFDLVLHGHQHDPHYCKVDFNVGTKDQSMIVLSAVACIKSGGSGELLRTRQFYALTVTNTKYIIESYCFHSNSSRFTLVREITAQRRPQSALKTVTYKITYKMKRNGDLEVVEERVYTAERGRKAKTVPIRIGVDQKSDECKELTALNMEVFLDGTKIGADQYEVLLNEPRDRSLRVSLPRPIGEEPSTIKVLYTWPGGFRRLLTDKRDEGEFTFESEIELFQVEIETEHEVHRIKSLDVIYEHNKAVQHLHGNSANKRGFVVRQCGRTNVLKFVVAIGES